MYTYAGIIHMLHSILQFVIFWDVQKLNMGCPETKHGVQKLDMGGVFQY